MKIKAVARSFGSDKSVNDADGNYLSPVTQKKFVLPRRDFLPPDAIFETIDRAVMFLGRIDGDGALRTAIYYTR